MSRDIDTRLSKAIITVLQECDGRTLGIRPLATYVNAALPVPATPDDVRRHVADLESKGYVERQASPLNAAELTWRITDAGRLL